jgi:hypothetical protein
MNTEGFVYRKARKRPVYSDITCAKRLQFALDHASWSIEDWAQILWSNETWAKSGSNRQV